MTKPGLSFSVIYLHLIFIPTHINKWTHLKVPLAFATIHVHIIIFLCVHILTCNKRPLSTIQYQGHIWLTNWSIRFWEFFQVFVTKIALIGLGLSRVNYPYIDYLLAKFYEQGIFMFNSKLPSYYFPIWTNQLAVILSECWRANQNWLSVVKAWLGISNK